MRKGLILLGLVALMMLLVPIFPAYAAPPQTVVTTATNNYIEIISPINDYLKTNTTYTFQYHLFNSSNGLPFTAKDNISCVFHLYALLGTHQFVRNDIGINNNIYDVGIQVTAGNFTKGFYNVLVQCNNSAIGGAFKQQFEITNTGIAPATDIMILFSYFMFIAVIVSFIYLLVYSIEKFSRLEFDMKDLVYNILGYIFLLITNIFNNQYFGISTLSPILLTFIVVGVFSMIAIPVYMFLMCYMKTILDGKHMREWGGGRG